MKNLEHNYKKLRGIRGFNALQTGCSSWESDLQEVHLTWTGDGRLGFVGFERVESVLLQLLPGAALTSLAEHGQSVSCEKHTWITWSLDMNNSSHTELRALWEYYALQTRHSSTVLYLLLIKSPTFHSLPNTTKINGWMCVCDGHVCVCVCVLYSRVTGRRRKDGAIFHSGLHTLH